MSARGALRRWWRKLFGPKPGPNVFYIENIDWSMAHIIGLTHDGKCIRVWVDGEEVPKTPEA